MNSEPEPVKKGPDGAMILLWITLSWLAITTLCSL